MKANTSADTFFNKQAEYKDGLLILRQILLSTGLEESIKWGTPVYTYEGKNIVGIGAFKSYFGLWYFQGSFLKDEEKVLINAQAGKTKGLRQWRFNNAKEINKKLILTYTKEAIQNHKEGKQVKVERSVEFVLPHELQVEIDKSEKLKSSFYKLTKGRQKEYAEYIDSAKREATRLNRVQKIIPMIENGVGLNDHYKK